MKTTLAQDREPRTSHSSRKYRSSFDQHKLRDYSKEGHVNPLKVKTSFLRNSLNLNSNQNLMSLNIPNSTHHQRKDSTGYEPYVFQSDRKEEIKAKKSQENFFGKECKSIQFTDSIKQSSFNGHSRRFSDRFSDYNNSTDMEPKNIIDEKQNKLLLGLSSSVGNDSMSSARNQIKSFAEKHQKSRFSQLNTQQSVFIDSSLADYATRLGLSVSKEDSSLSMVKDQIQLILKRLAKNQCDIQTLKRDKNVDVHMEKIWKEISSHESRFEKLQSKTLHINEKIGTWEKEIDKIRHQIMKVNHLKNEMKQFESRIQVDIKDKLMKKDNHHHSTLSSQGQNKVKREVQLLFNKLQTQLNNKVESKLLEFKIRTEGQDRIEEILKTGKLNVSQRKASNWIALVYKEVLRVKKQKQLQQIDQQSSYNESDRSKLLSKAFTGHHRRQSSSWLNQQQSSQNSLPYLSKHQTLQSIDVDINEVQYFIDDNGYLLDENKFYIVDNNDQPIRVDDKMIQKLVSKGLIRN